MSDFTADQSRIFSVSENQFLRFSFVFLTYVAQGLPIGMFLYAIPAWFAANGASAGAVGSFIAMTTLPWTLKFINGFLMDRYTYLPMGRRRPWLISAQILMVIGLTAMGLQGLRADDVFMLSLFSFVVNVAATYQDVAIDSMAVDLVPDGERARVNGMMFGGQSIGIALGSGGGGYVINHYGFSIAMFCVAAFVAFVLAFMISIRERPNEKLLPWLTGAPAPESVQNQLNEWKLIIAGVWNAFTEKSNFLLGVAILFYGSCFGLYLGTMPLVATQVGGWTNADFSALSGTANLISGILGVFVLGYVVDRIGWRNGFRFVTATIFVLFTLFAMLTDAWHYTWAIGGFVLLYLPIELMGKVSNCAGAMFRCVSSIGATQFTLYMAINNLGMTIGGALVGSLEAAGGYQLMLGMIGLIALIPFTIIFFVAPRKTDDHIAPIGDAIVN